MTELLVYTPTQEFIDKPGLQKHLIPYHTYLVTYIPHLQGVVHIPDNYVRVNLTNIIISKTHFTTLQEHRNKQINNLIYTI